MRRTSQVFSHLWINIINKTHLIVLSTAISNCYTYKMNEKDCQCLMNLQTINSQDNKKCIEKIKNGLFQDLYQWILENNNFQQWHNNQQSQLLWIKNNLSKSKTMLLCSIIDELKKSTAKTGLLSYFFCQSINSWINNVTAVLCSLIYLLVKKQPLLISHLQKKYDQRNKEPFKNVNVWFALFKIFTNILQDLSLKRTYLIVDALDECVTNLLQLLNLIVQKSSISFHVKWIVSSHNWLIIEKQLKTAEQKVRLSLELNAESVFTAVSTYIQHKVLQLTQLKNYDNKTKSDIQDHLSLNMKDTFLWVALICQNLEKSSQLNTLTMLNTFSPELDSLYKWMIILICSSDNVHLCKQILVFMTSIYHSITLNELTSFAELLNDTSDNLQLWTEVIRLCSSFLTIQDDIIYFVHQSVKDFLLKKTFNEIFSSEMKKVHYAIFLKSLKIMSMTLWRDIYSLGTLEFFIDNVKQPNLNPLVTVRYFCVF